MPVTWLRGYLVDELAALVNGFAARCSSLIDRICHRDRSDLLICHSTVVNHRPRQQLEEEGEPAAMPLTRG
jgi:hypothetical protein